MKLTGKLKEKVEKTETKEEAKQTIEEAGMILDDAELDQVAGGLPRKITSLGEQALSGKSCVAFLWKEGQ